jgi:hypothetical protein
MNTTTTTTMNTKQMKFFTSAYETDSDSDDSDSENDTIQQIQIPDKFKNEDFTEKLISNTLDNISTNIKKWVRSLEQKYIQRYGSKGRLLVNPRLQTRRWEIIRYIVNDEKYNFLSDIKPVLYPTLLSDDLIIVLEDRDLWLNRKELENIHLSGKLDNMTSKFRWAMSKAFQYGFTYGN